MKFAPARLVSRARQGLCGFVLAASLSTAAVGGPLTADASEADAGSQGARPRGVPNLSLPDLRKSSGGNAPLNEVTGIPATALDAYKKAARAVATSQPDCHLPWELVAGIGRIESVHASGYGLRGDGSTAKPIRGPRLDGKQFALIRDTDGGRWDGDTEYDRAIGPTQFIPSTWATWGADGNGDGVKDPNNIYDAALGTGRYLCAGDRNLADAGDLDRAVLSYNNSREYVNAVLDWMHTYEGGKATAIPDDTPAAPYRPDPAAGAHSSPTASRANRVSVTMGTAAIRRLGGPTATPPVTGKKPGPGGVTKPKSDSQPAARTVRHLDPVREQVLQADTGAELGRQFQVRATDAVGQVVARKGMTYEISGDTLARFAHGAKSVTVTTDAQGLAVAPPLLSGAKPGSFIVKASASGQSAQAVEFRVVLRLSPTATADTLKLVNEQPLRATGGSSFSDAVRVKATRYGQPAVGTRITATVIGSKDNPTERAAGPYFTGAGSGTPVRSLTLPPPGADGVVTFPEIHTDPHPGTYILRLTTPEGATLDVELTVEAPPAGS